MEKVGSGIQDKYPGSATLTLTSTYNYIRYHTVWFRSKTFSLSKAPRTQTSSLPHSVYGADLWRLFTAFCGIGFRQNQPLKIPDKKNNGWSLILILTWQES
jgi:hypothetical protein